MRTVSALDASLIVVAFVAAFAVLAIGTYVDDRALPRLDVEAAKVRGDALPLAIFFTVLGRWPALLAIGTLAAFLARPIRTGLEAVLTLVAAQLLSQATSTLLKRWFRRTRPDAWLHVRESDFSYPSGHATTAVVFYAGLAILAWHAPFPRLLATTLTAILAICAVGIPWSRLALCAHYATDVIGGLLLGTAWLSLALLVILRVTASP